MAGSASNWFRPSSGPMAGQAVYIDKPNQMDYSTYGQPKPISRQALLSGLNAGSQAVMVRVKGSSLPSSLPKGVAKTRLLAGPSATAPTGTAVGSNTQGAVHKAPNGQFGLYDSSGKLVRSYKTQGGATRALNKLGSTAQAAPVTRTPQPIGKNAAGYPKYKNDDFPLPTARTASGKPRVVIMAGLPASGKSSVRNRFTSGNSDFKLVDADEIKKSIPGYDPKNPGAVHAESSRRAYRQVDTYAQSGQPFVWDVTGINAKIPGVIKKLQNAGFEVDVMHVDVKESTSRARNAARSRVVPDFVISDTAIMLPSALRMLGGIADNAIAIDNEG